MMKEPEHRIEIPHTDLMKEKIKEVEEAVLLLYDDHLVYKTSFWALHWENDEDEAMGWKQEPVNPAWEYSIRKSSIMYLKIKKQEYSEFYKWWIEINAYGLAEGVQFFFKRETKAKEVYNTIYQWLYS